MNPTKRVIETTRKAMSPKLRDEIKGELCHEGIRFRLLGIKPVSEEMREIISKEVDAMSIEEVEEMYAELFPSNE